MVFKHTSIPSWPGFSFEAPSTLSFTTALGGHMHLTIISCLCTKFWPGPYACVHTLLFSMNCLWRKSNLTSVGKVLFLKTASFLHFHCLQQLVAILSSQSLLQSLSSCPSRFHSRHSWRGREKNFWKRVGRRRCNHTFADSLQSLVMCIQLSTWPEHLPQSTFRARPHFHLASFVSNLEWANTHINTLILS